MEEAMEFRSQCTKIPLVDWRLKLDDHQVLIRQRVASRNENLLAEGSTERRGSSSKPASRWGHGSIAKFANVGDEVGFATVAE
jgi:hypothetical protein